MVPMASFSACQCAVMAEDSSVRLAISSSSLARRSAEAGSVSLASAIRSISSWRSRRVTTSSSVGMESISMRRRLAASSIRSMALSGRNRPVTYRSDSTAAATSAASWMRTPWWTS